MQNCEKASHELSVHHQTDQKQSDGGSQDEASNHIRAVITVFGHPLQSGEERSTQRP